MAKTWAEMSPKERAAYARSFIGKKPKPAPSLGKAIQSMTQAQRDAILRHPAIHTRKRE